MSNQHSLRNAEIRKSCAMGAQDGMRTLTKSNHCESKLNNVDPCDQNVRRLCMRSALLAASQLLGVKSKKNTAQKLEQSKAYPRSQIQKKERTSKTTDKIR